MASSRDDFIIAIRSAFLKKSTQQKFSLLTLVFISIFIILLSSLDFRIIRVIKIAINEVVYRSSFVVSIPENLLKNTFFEISEYSTFYNDYKKNKDQLNQLKSENISSEITQNENKELKELINDYVSSSDKILAKIIVDHNSPFLKSIIINKGSKDKIKIGTNVYDQSYLVGRVIEVNYKTSRVLLLSDLNSNIPVTIAPQNVQAIITGTGDDSGQIKYIRDGFSEKFTEKSIDEDTLTRDVENSIVDLFSSSTVSSLSSTSLPSSSFSSYVPEKAPPPLPPRNTTSSGIATRNKSLPRLNITKVPTGFGGFKPSPGVKFAAQLSAERVRCERAGRTATLAVATLTAVAAAAAPAVAAAV